MIEQKKISCLKPQTVVYLQNLCVREDMRDKGIGTALMCAAKDYGKEKGADFIRTQVFPGNVDGSMRENGSLELFLA